MSGGNGAAEAGKSFDLKNTQAGQYNHGGSNDNVSAIMRKKQEILSSKDFPQIGSYGTGNHSSGRNLDGVARSLESGGSILGSDTMTFSSFLEPHEQPKVSCEMERDVYDVTTVRELDRTVKKYADKILHTLEGVSSRLVQLEYKTQRIETSVDELMNISGGASGKMSQLENILREVQTGIQVIRNKQEIAEAQFQLSKLQQSSKQDQTASPLENSTPMVSQQTASPPQQPLHPPLHSQPSYQQPPLKSLCLTPLQPRISLSSAPPHSHHAPSKLLHSKISPSTQPSLLPQTLTHSQNCQPSQHPPQTLPPPQKPLSQANPQINCQPDFGHRPFSCDSHLRSGSLGVRNNALKRRPSSMQNYDNSSYVGEEYVKVGHRRQKGRKWDEKDQVNLAKAWSCVSNSSLNRVNRDERSFWKGVMKEYNANYRPAEFRSIYGLKSYWKLLKQQCLLWKKVLSDFDLHMGSDGASTNSIKDVKTEFKSLNNWRKFEFKAAFEVLKDCPKWSAIDVDKDLKRPMRKATSNDSSQESSEASMPSGSNANIPTSDMQSSPNAQPKNPHMFISKESDEQYDILFLEKHNKNEYLRERRKQAEAEKENSENTDNSSLVMGDMSNLTPDLRVLSKEVKS